MSVYEITGRAKRRVNCDVAEIKITFFSYGSTSYKEAEKVMSDCDSFLKCIVNLGIDMKQIRLEDDHSGKVTFKEKECEAKRSIVIRTKYNMELINAIQTLLQKGKYEYAITVTGEISNIAQIKNELAKEALKNSREQVEQIASALGMTVKGVKSIKNNEWINEYGDIFGELYGAGRGKKTQPRPSDSIQPMETTVEACIEVIWTLK